MIDYYGLLLDFQALPRIQRASTFMEVSGYPHYENVASNILEFFFKPDGEHGLGNLLLSSFLLLSGNGELECSYDVRVIREQRTDKNGRLDILIEGPRFVLGIENKIYHTAENDFADYTTLIDNYRASEFTKIKVILSVLPVQTTDQKLGEFKRITYRQLWDAVRERLGQYVAGAHPKWLSYLMDFMETTTRLAGENQSDKEITDFFIKNHEIIERLVSDRQKLINRLDGYLRCIEVGLKDLSDDRNYLVSRYVWHSYVGGDYLIQNRKVVLDLNYSLTGWSLTILERNVKSLSFIQPLVSTQPMRECSPDIHVVGERYLLQSWDLHATELDLINGYVKWIKALIAAAEILYPSSQPLS